MEHSFSKFLNLNKSGELEVSLRLRQPNKETYYDHQNDYTLTSKLAEKGLDAVSELLHVLINNNMQAERAKYLQADEYNVSNTGKAMLTGTKRRPSRHA